MGIKKSYGLFVSLILLFLTAESQAQHNPSGWIQASAWNMLFLDQDGGCGGGGVARMSSPDWAAPYDIHEEDPQAGDEWDIDFNLAQSRSWTVTNLGELPTWVTAESLGANGFDDLVNFDSYVGAQGANTDNLVAISTTYVENTTEDPLLVEICTASDDSIRVDINNFVVTSVSGCRGSAGDCQEVNCGELAPGMNRITTYVWEGGGGWNMRFGLRDPATGVRITDISAKGLGIVFHGSGEGDLEGQVLEEEPECSLGQVGGPGDPVEPIEQPVNPGGWIRSNGWNMLFLDQDGGCGGGGVGRMLENWVAPYDMAEENPRPGEEWDIDFIEAESRSWTLNRLGEVPTWFTMNSLREWGLGIMPDDLVNFDSMAGQLGINTDNIVSISTTYVENTTEEPMTVLVCTASDDSVRVDINNYTVTNVSACRGSAGDCQEISCGVLLPGVNKLTAYVWEGGGGWNMRIGLRDMQQQILDDRSDGIIFHGTGEEDELEGQMPRNPLVCDLGINPSGWIRTEGWNLLFSLLNPLGCGGGGMETMAGNWVEPYELIDEDPQAGDAWSDMEFGLGLATDFNNGGLTEEPTWVTKSFLDEEFDLELPAGDLVDFQGMAQYLSTSGATQFAVPNDNVMGIATTYVINNSDGPLSVDVCTASDDSITVLVNEELVTNVSACRGSSADCQETRPAVLEPGINRIVVQVWEGGGGWNFRLGLRLDGAILSNGNELVEFLGAYLDGEPPGPRGDEICDNGIDDDEDGAVDCDDDDCSEEAACQGPPTPTFVRGDSDDNGILNLTDAIFNLNYLFVGGSQPGCFDASDADNNGSLQLTDGIFILNYLFLGGRAPPEPNGACGPDPTEPADGLGCETFNSCP